jgi:surfactin synthase thioesterase subunit
MITDWSKHVSPPIKTFTLRRLLIEIFITPLRADFEMVETYDYRPGERLSCPVTAHSKTNMFR